MIIGFTGPYCAGKDTAAEYLVKHKGFIHYSLSDELRDELRRNGIFPGRENLIRIGSELRAKEGYGILAERVLARCSDEGHYVVTSIRHPSEIAALQKRRGFCLVNLEAPDDIRFRRMRERKREGDPETLERLRELEQRESQARGSGQQLKNCSRRASLTIINDGTMIQEFHGQLEALLADVRKMLS